jgi:hypothetical protein
MPDHPADAPPDAWTGLGVGHPLQPAARAAGDRWRGWQVAIIALAAALVGLLAGVIIGNRLADDDADDDATRVLGSTPMALGEVGAVGSGWALRVVSADPDAGAVISDLRDANEPPGANESYLLVTLELAFDPSGASPGSVGEPQQVLLALIDERGARYLPHERSCGLFPNPVFTYGVLSPGERITANQCWAVPTDKVPGMVLVAATATRTTSFALR